MTTTAAPNRRLFLKTAASAALAATYAARSRLAWADTPAPSAVGVTKGKSYDPVAFRKSIEGPIFSLPTPYTSSFEVDHAGITKSVDRAAKAGIKLFMLTSGNGDYRSLYYDEIKAITRTFVEAVAGRGIVVASGDAWWTGQAVDYAKYAESVGADGVQVMLPAGRGGDDSVVKHYREVAAAMKLPIVLHGEFSAPLLRKLLPEVPSIAAMKEDVALEYYIARQIEFGDRVAVFAGGGEHRFLIGMPYGSRAFYSVYAPFAPDIAMKYWAVFQTGDMKQAADLIRKYDHPYIEKFSMAFWHASMEYFGVAQRYLRPPVESYTDAQMKEVKPFFDGQGLDPKSYQT